MGILIVLLIRMIALQRRQTRCRIQRLTETAAPEVVAAVPVEKQVDRGVDIVSLQVACPL